MKRPGRNVVAAAALAALAAGILSYSSRRVVAITVDYPLEGSVFPPERVPADRVSAVRRLITMYAPAQPPDAGSPTAQVPCARPPPCYTPELRWRASATG
jgi:hypothetical protein